MGIQSPELLRRIMENLKFQRPTHIQAQSFHAIKGITKTNTPNVVTSTNQRYDVMIGAETGTGKSYAYLIPLLDSILQEKAIIAASSTTTTTSSSLPLLPTYDYTRVMILVPNKELVHQVIRMAAPLCGGTIRQTLIWGGGGGDGDGTRIDGLLDPLEQHEQPQQPESDPSKLVRMAIMPGGLKDPLDFKPFRDSIVGGNNRKEPPVDIVVTTPAALSPLALKPNHVAMFADIPTLVIDEADMLLDGGYLRSLENVLMGFRRADRLAASFSSSSSSSTTTTCRPTQHIFCSATLPDSGLKSVHAYLQHKFPRATRITLDNMHNARHSGLQQPTQWIPLETKQERMNKLVELLGTAPSTATANSSSSPTGSSGLRGEKVMIFLNSVEDVEGVYQALIQRGIPAVPYHAKLSLAERHQNLQRFRKYLPPFSSSPSLSTPTTASDADTTAAPILVCTDLASRGLDVPGVTVVLQLQFASNVVSHLHRMGRCGRAGQRHGRGVVFYDPKRESDLVQMLKQAEEQQERMYLKQDVLTEDGEEGWEDATMDVVDNGQSAGEEVTHETNHLGKVESAFSRKRGFTKKRKKELKREQQQHQKL
jgi:superfamily II DNA/RNA helicase